MLLKVSFYSVLFSMIHIRFICVFFCFVFVVIFYRFRDPQGVLGFLEGPQRALRVLGSSPGRFWDLSGRPGGVPGRRPIITFRR